MGGCLTSAQCWAETVSAYHVFIAIVAVAALALVIDTWIRIRRK